MTSATSGSPQLVVSTMQSGGHDETTSVNTAKFVRLQKFLRALANCGPPRHAREHHVSSLDTAPTVCGTPRHLPVESDKKHLEAIIFATEVYLFTEGGKTRS